MKKTLLCLLLSLLASACSATSDNAQNAPALDPQPQEAQAALWSAQFLTRYHYKHETLDDTLSAKIFDNYLKSLDPEHMLFLQADVDELSTYRLRLDDAIEDGALDAPFAIFRRYEERAAQRYQQARNLLPHGFDFTRHETLVYPRDKAPWPADEAEASDLWRKRVKNDWLRLKLAGKDDRSIAQTLDKRYDNALKSLGRLKSDDVFQIFMNAYTGAIDPHTNYLGPRASEDFDISMRLSLVGIGAVLQEKDDYTVIRELVPGGPAALSGRIKVGDRIVGVGQGANAQPEEVIGWRLDDTVAVIRGQPDSVVVLDILPASAGPDGKHKRVTLTRKKINLDRQAASKSLLTSADGRRIGVITLPAFYEDFEARQRGDANYRSASRDVARLIGELKKDKIDGLLIDLRDDGGGSLDEAVALTGLFIDRGPVVQQRNSRDQLSVESDKVAGMAWDGPLGVLINRNSASASEIFAAAIQDYGRGLIVGSQSFGKGTVQTMIDLDEVARNDKPTFGELKMTVAQFFRINGGTTQLRGVTPDIALPNGDDPATQGESSYDNALPWTQIAPADYRPVGDLHALLPTLQARHDTRVASNHDYRSLQEDFAEIATLRARKEISLNEAERRQERDAREARLKARTPAALDSGKGKNGKNALRNLLQDDGLQANERDLPADVEAEEQARKAPDILQQEAASIVGDEATLLHEAPHLAKGSAASPGAPR
jgi:carboxyl-terminal processing protease